MGITSSTATVKSGGSTQTLFGNFNIKLLFYILVAILIEFAFISFAMSANKYIIMAIFIPLSLFIFVVYGQRWFGSDGLYSNKNVQWPPAMNTCPDFLTAYVVPKNGSVSPIKGCVDPIGVSRNGGFKRLTSETPSSAPSAAMTVDAAKNMGVVDFFPIQVALETPTQLCSRLQTAGLTWEGIYDGENCYSAGSIISGGGAAQAAICK